jgi:hypothetical protein
MIPLTASGTPPACSTFTPALPGRGTTRSAGQIGAAVTRPAFLSDLQCLLLGGEGLCRVAEGREDHGEVARRMGQGGTCRSAWCCGLVWATGGGPLSCCRLRDGRERGVMAVDHWWGWPASQVTYCSICGPIHEARIRSMVCGLTKYSSSIGQLPLCE